VRLSACFFPLENTKEDQLQSKFLVQRI